MKKSLIIHPYELNKKWIDKMVAGGIDILGIHPVGGVLAHQTLEKLLIDVESEKFRELIDYACSSGLKIEYEFHCASYLLPRELYDTHPEYFRKNSEGERVREYNFCVSNEEAMEYVSKRAAQLVKKLYRSEHVYYLWLDDGKDIGCKCEKCAHLSDSEQQLMILNSMIREIRKDIPDAKLCYLAYYDTITPPEKITPADGIFLEYAPIERNFKKRVCESDPSVLENIQKLIRFFGKKDAKVLEYWLDNSLFSNWKPDNIQKLECDNQLIKDDVAYYNNLGFDYISTFACYLGEEYEKLYGEADISGFCDA